MEHAHGPSVLVLTRQNCPQLSRSSAELTATRGGYTVWDTDEKQTPEVRHTTIKHIEPFKDVM